AQRVPWAGRLHARLAAPTYAVPGPGTLRALDIDEKGAAPRDDIRLDLLTAPGHARRRGPMVILPTGVVNLGACTEGGPDGEARDLAARSCRALLDRSRRLAPVFPGRAGHGGVGP